MTRYSFAARASVCREIQVGDFGGEGFGVEVGAIAEGDYGDAVGEEALDVGVEADGVAVVPHAGVIAMGVEKPAETVGDRGAFRAVGVSGPFELGTAGELRGSQGGLHFFFG